MINQFPNHQKHNRVKTALFAALFSCLGCASVLAQEVKNPPDLPTDVTQAMMKKYAIRHVTIEKKVDCNGVDDPLLDAYCERPVLQEKDSQLKQLLQQVKSLTPSYDHVDVTKDQDKWQKEHDDCIKARDSWMCLELSYIKRISELQSQFNLVPKDGPLLYDCDHQAKLTLTFYATELPTVVAVYQDQHKEAFMGPDSKGHDYKSDELKVTERKGGATVYWNQGLTLTCTQKSVTKPAS